MQNNWKIFEHLDNQEQKPIEENKIVTKIKLQFTFGLVLVYGDTTPEINRNKIGGAQNSIAF